MRKYSSAVLRPSCGSTTASRCARHRAIGYSTNGPEISIHNRSGPTTIIGPSRRMHLERRDPVVVHGADGTRKFAETERHRRCPTTHASVRHPRAAALRAGGRTRSRADTNLPDRRRRRPVRPASSRRNRPRKRVTRRRTGSHGRLDGITAKLVVRYHLAAVGPSGFNHFQLDLPDNGVVTGATVTVDGAAHRLAFEAMEQGNARFDAVLATSPPDHTGTGRSQVEHGSGTSVDVDRGAARDAVDDRSRGRGADVLQPRHALRVGAIRVARIDRSRGCRTRTAKRRWLRRASRTTKVGDR